MSVYYHWYYHVQYGTDTYNGRLKILAQRPFDICVGAVAQYLIMPFLAFALSKVLNLPDGIALGLILVGCCPGGVSSNIMSYLCGGDVAFSVE